MAIGKRWWRPGRRTALAAVLGLLAVLSAGFTFREDLLAWFVGYRFIWAPEGVEPSRGNALNAAGQLLVAGGEGVSDGVWSIGSGSVVRLEPHPGSDGVARAHVINEKGCIAGAVEPREPDGTNRPFRWSPEGGMQLLPSPGKGLTSFKDLNQREEAVANLEAAGLSGEVAYRAFLWTPQDGFHALEGLAGRSFANAINESGWIAGSSSAADGRQHPVLWMPPDRRPQDLGLPAGFDQDLCLPEGFDQGAAVGVNDGGTLLINCWNNPWLDIRPFLWTAERGYVGLPLSGVVGEAIDQQGTVLVKAGPLALITLAVVAEFQEKKFLIRRGSVLFLPRPRGAEAYEYHGLTDGGWLIGRAQLTDRPDSWRGFVARPVR